AIDPDRSRITTRHVHRRASPRVVFGSFVDHDAPCPPCARRPLIQSKNLWARRVDPPGATTRAFPTRTVHPAPHNHSIKSPTLQRARWTLKPHNAPLPVKKPLHA